MLGLACMKGLPQVALMMERTWTMVEVAVQAERLAVALKGLVLELPLGHNLCANLSASGDSSSCSENVGPHNCYDRQRSVVHLDRRSTALSIDRRLQVA